MYVIILFFTDRIGNVWEVLFSLPAREVLVVVSKFMLKSEWDQSGYFYMPI